MSDLGDRMKRYEAIPALRLMPKTPVLIRLDGKAFHSLCRGMEKPWDGKLANAMWFATRKLCEEISGCRLGYVQSDEISLLLVDYQSQQTQGWFDYELQKLVSVSASMATAWFNLELGRQLSDNPNWPVAAFDARAWNLPACEVTNYFIWRQQDASRNSVSSLAQAHFSHKALNGKSGPAMQDMLIETGINWNDCPVPQKRGVCVVRETYTLTADEMCGAIRHRWIVDERIPIFTEDREYVERYVRPEGFTLDAK